MIPNLELLLLKLPLLLLGFILAFIFCEEQFKINSIWWRLNLWQKVQVIFLLIRKTTRKSTFAILAVELG
jgi:hypothetical protein